MAAATTTTTTTFHRIRWRTLWTVLIAAFWSLIVLGLIGGYVFNLNTGFPQNGTLWDWLQLLSAPVFVTALPFVFSGPQSQDDHKVAERQSEVDLQVADDQKQESELEAYQNYILELLLDKNLGGSQPGSDVRKVAKSRTLTALRRVGKNHKGELLQFLYEAGLIYKGKVIVELHGADLRGADLSNARLSGADLSGVDLSETRLSGADLSGADLSETRLNGSDISNANLNGANLRGAIYTNVPLSNAQPPGNKYIAQ